MKPLDASELLQIWERSAGNPPAQAILALLLAACPEIPAERLPQLTIGERDALLLTQREWMFGPELAASVTCPQCSERLEFSLTVNDLRAIPVLSDAHEFGQSTTVSAEIEGYQIEFHPPTIADTQHAASLEKLLDQCVLTASKGGESKTASELPPAVIEGLSHQMAAADPQADTQLALTCPACGHDWLAPFDIAIFLWEEIQTWAQRTLLEIHQLAITYGWQEADILALTPARRQIYLSMISVY
jgi:hypothetical protein